MLCNEPRIISIGPNKILENMVAFIKQHGREEAVNIQTRTNEDYTKAFSNAYNDKKEIIIGQYKQ